MSARRRIRDVDGPYAQLVLQSGRPGRGARQTTVKEKASSSNTAAIQQPTLGATTAMNQAWRVDCTAVIFSGAVRCDGDRAAPRARLHAMAWAAANDRRKAHTRGFA
jgi:hypothetical protein